MYENHLCLTFERLYENLYEVLKLRKFKGFSLETIASVADQLLKALSILDASTIIHADLKPENILLMKPYRGDEEKGLQIKLADFGSAVVGFGETLGTVHTIALLSCSRGYCWCTVHKCNRYVVSGMYSLRTLHRTSDISGSIRV